MRDLVFEKRDTPMTSSLIVAEYFGKRHDHVIRDIETKILTDVSADFTAPNFGASYYKDSTGKKNKMYLMTKDGFSLLAMGFTGKKAMEFKIAYIAAFNQMASFIRQLDTAKSEFHELTDAIKFAHSDEVRSYHFSNEFDLINRIIFGVSTKKLRKERGIPDSANSIRPYLSETELKQVIRLQRFDSGLIVTTPKYEDRKRILTEYHGKVVALPMKSMQLSAM